MQSADRLNGSNSIGPKAQSLRRLADAGLPVPEARFLGVEAYEEHAARAGVADLVSAGREPAEIRAAILSIPVAADTVARLREWHAELGSGLAVRSSGTAEDLPHASFAGQHGTYFVTREEDLIERVRDCWASLFSDRASVYRASLPDLHGDVAMAVIVQRLVPSVAAGVAFTQDPVTGADAVIVEACLGIGESLVSGKVTPDRFVFSGDGRALRGVDLGHKRVRIAVNPWGGVTESAVPPDEAEHPSVDEGTALEAARLAVEAEAVFGCAVDVEWAFDGARVWLLQARPITACGPGPAGMAAATRSPVEPQTIWSNVNTGEILPDVATPMTWTVIHHHAQEIFGGMVGAFGVKMDAQKTIGLVGGRIYFNLTLLHEAFDHLPGLDVDVVLGGMHDYVELPPHEQRAVSRWAKALAASRARCPRTWRATRRRRPRGSPPTCAGEPTARCGR
jgi:hypothetical protein